MISKTKAYKLGDMGQSAIARLSSDDVEEGDARYLAPELLNPGEFGEKSDLKKADVFSLGMTLFELATGNLEKIIRDIKPVYRIQDTCKWK